MEILLQVILSWVLRTLNLKEGAVKVPRPEIVNKRQMNDLVCKVQFEDDCTTAIYIDYETDTIYIYRGLEIGESAEHNGAIVEAFALFVLVKNNKQPVDAVEFKKAYEKAQDLREKSKIGLLKYLVI